MVEKQMMGGINPKKLNKDYLMLKKVKKIQCMVRKFQPKLVKDDLNR